MSLGNLKEDILKAKEKIKTFEIEAKEEGRDDYVAAEILVRFLEDKPVSEVQIEFLKKQSIDFAKVLALIGLQAVPGSSVAIVLLEKIGKNMGFPFFPTLKKLLPSNKK